MTPFLQLTPEVAARIVGERRYHLALLSKESRYSLWSELAMESMRDVVEHQSAVMRARMMLNAVTDK